MTIVAGNINDHKALQDLHLGRRVSTTAMKRLMALGWVENRTKPSLVVDASSHRLTATGKAALGLTKTK